MKTLTLSRRLGAAIRNIGRSDARQSLSDVGASIQHVAELNSMNSYVRDALGVQHIDADSSMTISAVYSCVTLISDCLSTIPLHIKERTASCGRQTVYNHPIACLWKEPSPKIAKIAMLKSLVSSVLLRGNGYAHIAERDSQYRPTRINFYLPTEVMVYTTRDSVYYSILGVDGYIPSRDMIHLKGYTRDGIIGISPITLARENMELAASATIYGNKFFEQGCHTTGVFTYPHTLPEPQMNVLKRDLAERYAGLVNTAVPLVLEGGLEYKPISMTQEDAQYLQTRKFQTTEIASIFHVPPHMIGNLDKSSYNNNEQQFTEFIAMCLRPLAVQFEDEFNRKLLSYSEQAKYFHQFELDGLARGDLQARAAYYKDAINNGWMKPNEVREKEDLPPVDGGDKLFIPMNLANINEKANDNE